MKMLIVSALVCAMMVLTRAAESHLVKRWTDCPLGWSLSGDRCYHYNRRHMTWTSAEKNCQAQGGNLASVHNIRQFFHVQKVIFQATRTYDLAWIGGSDAQENGQWFWSDGTPFRYRHWCHGESNDGVVGGQHCLQINFSGHKCWDYIPCSKQLPSVCVMNSK